MKRNQGKSTVEQLRDAILDRSPPRPAPSPARWPRPRGPPLHPSAPSWRPILPCWPTWAAWAKPRDTRLSSSTWAGPRGSCPPGPHHPPSRTSTCTSPALRRVPRARPPRRPSPSTCTRTRRWSIYMECKLTSLNLSFHICKSGIIIVPNLRVDKRIKGRTWWYR